MSRIFIKPDLKINQWTDLEPYVNALLSASITSEADFEAWLKRWNELCVVTSEDLAWRYIHMTCDTTHEEHKKSYLDFVQYIQPSLTEATNALNQKMYHSGYAETFNEAGFALLRKQIETELQLFRPENIALQTALQDLEQAYSTRCGAQTVQYNSKTLTLQQASVFLKDNNSEIRKSVYELIQKRRAEDEEFFNQTLSKMIDLRHQMAVNAGCLNYRDYKHRALNRFDYTVTDCFTFHAAIEQVAVPLYRKKEHLRRQKMKSTAYMPWDVSVDVDGLPPLKPFKDGSALLDKTIACFNAIDPFFGECLGTMKSMGRLDLESRIGKAPGGYQYPLYESKVPFIFMNAVGLHRDLVTMVHEGGHALHSFLYKDLNKMAYQSPPSEIAELASMGMELISMEHWSVFFNSATDLKRAKSQQLEGVLDTLPWIAAIDAFQHALYEHPTHDHAFRSELWLNLMNRFGNTEVDYSNHQNDLARKWQAQLHIFEVPFYYIEYGIAQMGAIALWRNYKQNPKQTITAYKTALSLGYTQSLPELYKAAGIRFEFTASYMQELMDFVWQEYVALQA